MHSFMCMQSHCTFCDRDQQADRFIPVQFRTITHCLLAHIFYFCYADKVKEKLIAIPRVWGSRVQRPPSASVATKELLAGAIPAGNVIFDLFFFIICS